MKLYWNLIVCFMLTWLVIYKIPFQSGEISIIEEQHSADKIQEAYRTVLAEYDRAWQDEDYTMEKWQKVDDITIEYISSKTVHYSLGYCIEDLVNDGIPELIIGARREGEGEYEPIALFIYNGEKAILAISRERYFINIYQDGIVEVWGAAGGEVYMFFQIEEGTDGVEYLGELIVKESDERKTWFYKEEVDCSEVEIEEDEFTYIMNQYTTAKEELEWKPLEGFWKPESELK